MPMQLIREFERHASMRQCSTALWHVDSDGRTFSMTWRELHSASTESCHLLLQECPPGSVILSAPNGPQFVRIFLAAMMANRHLVPVSPFLTPSELVQVAQTSAARTLVGDKSAADALGDLISRYIPLETIAPCNPRARPRLELKSGGGAVLMQSSGSTGLPKIVLRTALSLDAVGRNSAEALNLSRTDRVLVPVPLYHAFGMEQGILAPIMAGSTIYLMEKFDAELALSILEQQHITVMPGVPFMFETLATWGAETRQLTDLRCPYSAGGPLPKEVFDAFERRFGIRLGQLYGTTEFGAVTFNDPHALGFNPRSVGPPMTDVRIRIVDFDDANADNSLPIGHEGEVAVSAPSLMSHYVDGTDNPTVHGFFLSGDIGFLDEAGRLTLTGRRKLVIDIGGMKVNLMEVESVIARHPAVDQVAVVPLPISDTQVRTKAIIALKRDSRASAESLRAFTRQHLIKYKVPRVFEIRDRLPASPTGKILRQAL